MSRDGEPRTTQENAQFDAAKAAARYLSPNTIPGTLEAQLVQNVGTTHDELNGKKTDNIAPSVFAMKALPGDVDLSPVGQALAQRNALRAEYEAEMTKRKAESNKSAGETQRSSFPSSADIFKPRINR